ncbi:MAG: ATP-binding protein [Desulfocapsaceae bacterium]|jgi:two-component system phosphate regulon sensor histidine kinase PhoR|nr:ATP-binding protein [Desulfocapsaceae bacterium]
MIFKQRKLFWQIFPATLVIILLSIIAVGWYSSYSANSFYLRESARNLLNRANIIKSHVVQILETGTIAQLQQLAVESGRASETRITVIDRDGIVLADSEENPESMDNHRQRPEINEAFSGTPGTSLRFSNTIGERMLYSAIPLTFSSSGSGTVETVSSTAVLRLSMPVIAIDSALSALNVKLLFGTIIAVIVAFLVTLFVSRNISRPLEEMTERAEYYSQGDFSRRMMIEKATASREVSTLARAMDRMADQLDDMIKTIVKQRNQLETVFSSMVEAVIAVDRHEKIISINSAAADMFKVKREKAEGQLVQGVIRNATIQQQIKQVLMSGGPLEDEIALGNDNRQRYLQFHVVALSDGNGSNVGVLVVLNDVTRLRRLENVRRDFVANVSHELRTPITSIRGYVETLLEGAMDDPENARKFLETVLRQSEQLSEIIDDLLVLSRIEQDAPAREMRFDRQLLYPVLEDAIQTCFQKAREREISLVLDCDRDIQLNMNRTLFEQAVINLVVNAVTYSDRGDTVTIEGRSVTGEKEQQHVEIRVIDTGVGIAADHLPRLFERFYRSDKARNRKVGGTGLGLSIVKHIIQIHKGDVDVESTLGAGSTFIVRMPAA